MSAIAPLLANTSRKDENRRRDARSNVLMAGKLASATRVEPVQIRDVSRGGALLVGNIAAPLGSAFVLQIKNFSLPCRLAWSSAARAGIAFDEPFTDYERLSRRGRGQAEVDTKIAQVRAGVAPNLLEVEQCSIGSKLSPRIAEEMRSLQRRLESLGDSLANDPILMFRYQRQLQDIDVMMQILGHLATVTEADDHVTAAMSIGREALRRRLLR
ncbi:PilZ domain-containing protein [Sphingomicrobium clamense]|uniref:PilZ domain-containing protein n=1 Tax=Sphingomicrobium clamense TaxID=2851013 RepID=UPI003CE4D3EF